MNGPPVDCRQVQVAAVSFSPEKFDIEGNARRLEELFRTAAAKGAELVLAPEGALDGIVALGVLTGQWPARRAREAALTLDDGVIQRFQALAAELSVCLAFGFAERIGGDIYNAAVLIDGQGQLKGQYHKMVLAEGYHDSWWFNRIGSSSRAIDTPFGPCGFMICYDRWDPRAARLPVLDGATFLLAPTYGNRSEHNDQQVLARARENQVPLVQANGSGAALIIRAAPSMTLNRSEETKRWGEGFAPPPFSRYSAVILSRSTAPRTLRRAWGNVAVARRSTFGCQKSSVISTW